MPGIVNKCSKSTVNVLLTKVGVTNGSRITRAQKILLTLLLQRFSNYGLKENGTQALRGSLSLSATELLLLPTAVETG